MQATVNFRQGEVVFFPARRVLTNYPQRHVIVPKEIPNFLSLYAEFLVVRTGQHMHKHFYSHLIMKFRSYVFGSNVRNT